MKRKLSPHAPIRAWIAIAMAALLGSISHSAEPPPADGNRTRTVVALTAEDLGTFLDEFVPQQLDRRKIAGAIVSVVSGDTTLLTRGYGYANVQERTPIRDTTLFRVGSISKLFVSLAVAQLVERGQLDLDRDVNDYLDFTVPHDGGVPVTLRLLLAHRAGYENYLKDLFGRGTTPRPLGEWLRESQPPRLFPHGDVQAYSNYGYGLAGYIVERVAGMSFETYVTQHIFQPLDMSRATFAQPLPVTPEFALGYSDAASPPLTFFETIAPSPAGAMSVSGADMGRFLRAIASSSDGNRIRIPGVATEYELLGSEEDLAAGNRFSGKRGLMLSFVSAAIWLPEQRFGLFVSYNSETGARAPTELLNAIAERYFARSIPRATSAATGPHAAELAGAYQVSQRADSTFFRLIALATRQVVVSAQPDDSIRLSTATDAFASAGGGVFRSQDGQEVRFAQRASSALWTLRWSAIPLAVEWERAPWYLDARIVLPSTFGALGVAVATLLCWPIAALERRRRQRAFGNSAVDRRDYVATRAALVLHVLVFGSFAFMLAQFNDPMRLNAALDPWLIALFALAWLAIIATPLSLWTAVRFWRDRVGTRWTRLYHTLIAASAALLAWLWFVFRVAGTKLDF